MSRGVLFTQPVIMANHTARRLLNSRSTDEADSSLLFNPLLRKFPFYILRRFLVSIDSLGYFKFEKAVPEMALPFI
jgi:hypothetical protein